jgi:hypothetical protein
MEIIWISLGTFAVGVLIGYLLYERVHPVAYWFRQIRKINQYVGHGVEYDLIEYRPDNQDE